MCMSVKILNWKLFHTCKHVISQIPKSSLAYIDHDPVVQIGTGNSNGIKSSHFKNCHGKRMKIRLVRLQKREYVLIDQCLCKHSTLYICKHTDKYGHYNDPYMDLIAFQDVSHQHFQHFSWILHLWTNALSWPSRYFSGIIHACSPPLFSSKSPPAFVWE